MDSLTGGSSDPISKQTEVPSRQSERKSLIQRLLRRNGSAELEASAPQDSTPSAPKHSVVERLEGFFVRDLPSEMGNFPPPPEEPAVRVADQEAIRSTGDMKTPPNSSGSEANEENSGGVSSTFSAVRTIRTTAKEAIARSQEAYQELEAKLKVWVQELEKNRELLSHTDAATAVKMQELRKQATKDVAELLQKSCQPVLARSIEQLQQRSEAAVAALSSAAETAAASLRELREAMARSLAAEADTAFQAALARSSEQLRKESEAVLAASSQLMQKQSEAVLAQSAQRAQNESDAALAGLKQQLDASSDSIVAGLQEKLAAGKQRFLAEADTELEKLRASRDGLIEDAQKQLAASLQTSLEALARSEKEKARGELEALRENFVNESQSQVVSTFRTSIDLLTKGVAQDLVERAAGDLAASRQAFVQDTQKRLDQMGHETIERLQSQATEAAERATASLNASNQLLLEKAHVQVAGVARESFSSMLESEIKSAVERGRQELGNMVDGFLTKAVPQIQVELERLVNRHMEEVRKQPEPQIVARPAPQVSLVQTPQERTPALHSAAAQNSLERPSVPTPSSPHFGVSQLDLGASAAARFSAPQIDPMAITTSQLARARMIEPPRVTPAPAAPAPTPRALEFRLAESAAKQRRIEVRDLKEGISSGLKLGLAIGAMALVVFGIYFFLSPAVRLKANPPAAFLDDNPAWSASQRARENRIAHLYWQVAVTQVQLKYAFGSTLPENVPDEFAVSETEPSGASGNGSADARARYWQKLRGVWAQPDSWERISKWDPESIRVTWNDAVSKMNSLFGSSRASSATP